MAKTRSRQMAAQRKRVGRRAFAMASVLIVSCLMATGILAWRGSLSSSSTRSATAGRMSAQNPSPPTLAKEFVYASGKLVSTVESGTAGSNTPLIQSISPSSGNPGDVISNLTINGTNLAGASLITFDTPQISGSVTSSSAGQVMASVTISSSASSGTRHVSVTTPGGQSNQATFTVNDVPGAPQINSMSPVSAFPGDSFTLSIGGTGLSTVNTTSGISFTPIGFTGTGSFHISAIAPQGDAAVTASVSIDATATAGNYNVAVTNAAGQSSNTVQFTLNAQSTGGGAPAPVIDHIAPTSILINTSFTMQVFGSSFQSTSQIVVNYNPVTTTFVSSTELDATLSFDFAGFESIAVSTPPAGNPPSGGGSSKALTLTVNNPAPVLNSISPSAVAAGGTGLSLTANGSGFVAGNGQNSIVKVNGASRSTQDGSTGSITGQLTAADIANPGTLSITVFTVGPGGGTSSPQTLLIVAPPVISGLNPQTVTAGTAAFTLTVTGSNFRSTDQVKVNALGRATTFISSTQLTAAISVNDIAVGTVLSISVSDSGPGGSSSGVLSLTVNNPLPAVTGISPASIPQGTTPGTLTVNGDNFVTASVVQVNGASRVTTFGSSTQLTAALTTADLANVATLNITVLNPAPGGGSSNVAPLAIIPPPPAAPTALTATAISGTEINLAWTDNSNNETAFVIQRKIGSGGTYSTLISLPPNTMTYSDTGLTASTTYFYKVLATNNGSNSSPSNEYGATPYGAVPAAPSNVTATGVSNTQVNLTWTDANTNETGIKLERKTGSSGAYAQVAVLCPNTTSYSDTGLTLATTYYYRLRSYNSAGDSAYSTETSGTTLGTPPAAPSNLVATAQVGLQASLTWTSNSNNEAGFYIERKTQNSSFARVGSVGQGVTSFTDTGLDADTNYCYRVQAFNGGGTSAYSNTSCTTTGDSIIRIPEDYLRRSETLTLVAALTPIGFDAPPPAAWSRSGLSPIYSGLDWSPFRVESAAGPLGNPPAAPVGLKAWAVNTSQINISWIAGDATQTGFSLERATAVTGPFSAVASLCGSILTYSDTGLTSNTTYYYRILASNGNGNSAYSNTSSATTPPAPIINSISPSYVLVGTAPFNLTVNGINFVSNSIVEVNGDARTTTYVSGTQLTAALLPADLNSVATLAITVINPAPAPVSNGVSLNVVANNTPTITSLSPASIIAGSGAFNLIVNGTGYVSASTVKVGGSNRATTFVGPTQLIAAISASDVALAGTLTITVVNPAPGTGSAGFSFTVNNPVPTIGSLSPSSVVVGSVPFTLTVNGSNFVNTSVAKVNGNARTTTFANAGQLTVAIPGADVAAIGSLTITVSNPAPGGGTSNSKTLTVTSAVPAAPSNLTATELSMTQVSLTWTSNSNNQTGFNIYFVGGNGNVLIGTVGAGVTSFVDNNASPNDHVCYQVTAFNSAGESALSNQGCAFTF
jgi:hypothetical protein